MNTKHATCADRVNEYRDDRIEDLRKLWDLWLKDCEASDEDIGNLDEYGLCFDYVAPGTFNDQSEAYFRYQLSTGGPGDEFRIYANQTGEYSWSVYRIEYWLLDWSDGAHKVLQGTDLDLLKEIFQCRFVEGGIASHLFKESLR